MGDSIQSVFLEQVKEHVPPHVSFVDDLAELLSISRDSVYRRIRGETTLSLEEVKKICAHYNVSLDGLLAPTGEMISFHHQRVDQQNFRFPQWLHNILGKLEMISAFPVKELVYAAKDLPPFHYFNQPNLSAFKMFFWMKYYHASPELADKNFSADLISRELLAVGRKVYERYQEIPSVEIWSDETPMVTLRQIEYAHHSGVITSALAAKLIDEYLAIIEEVFLYARSGRKNGAEFEMYRNEILIAETSILFRMGDKRVAFLAYNIMNLLSTSQESFCNSMEEYFSNLISKSAKISITGEKERNYFINRIRESAEAVRKRLT